MGAFVTARPVALEIATKDKQDKEEVGQRPSKRRRTERHSGGASEVTVRTTRSRSKRTTQNDQHAGNDGAADQGSDAEYTEPSTTQPERQQTPDDGLVACPICQTRMKEEAVFGHIGTPACTSPSQKQRQQPPKPTIMPKPQNSVILPDRLTELNYSLLNEKALRKKLSELGIPSTGSKALLSRRHTEYVNLWNANVDAGAPRSKRELLAELAKWDRSIGRDYAESGGNGGINGGGAGAQIMKKDFDAKAWEKGNKDDFARLIAEARKGRSKAAPKPDSTAESTANNESKEGEAQSQPQPDPMAVDPSPPAQLNPETDLPQGYHNATSPQENFPSIDRPPPSGQRVHPPPLPSKETSLPEKFKAEGAQTIDMFEVSSHPVADVETMQEGGGGGGGGR